MGGASPHTPAALLAAPCRYWLRAGIRSRPPSGGSGRRRGPVGCPGSGADSESEDDRSAASLPEDHQGDHAGATGQFRSAGQLVSIRATFLRDLYSSSSFSLAPVRSAISHCLALVWSSELI